MSDNSSSKKEILVCFLIDSRLHLTTQLYRSTVPLVASMVHNIPERDDVKWRVVCADRRDERNAAFFDPDATSGLRGSKLYCLSVLEFLKTFSNIPANDDESKSQQISQWHQALQGQNNSLITKEIDVAETENLAAIITRLPRQSHEFSVHFDDLIKQREKKFSQKFLVVNNPLGAELCGSKQFLLNLRKWCPVLEQVSSKEEIKAFYEKHKQSGIVLKPLNSSGGKGIIKIDSNGKVWLGVQEPDFQSLEAFLNSDCPDLNPVSFIAMKYLKNVKEGDKRIIVIDGEIIGASLRKPTGESWLCNASQGGTSHASFVSDYEKEMVKDVSKIVSEYGVLFIGLDTLVDDDGQRILSEVNCVTIGGMNPLQSVSGKPILKMTAEALWHSITKRCL